MKKRNVKWGVWMAHQKIVGVSLECQFFSTSSLNFTCFNDD